MSDDSSAGNRYVISHSKCNHYLDPWCINANKSSAFEDFFKKSGEPSPLCSISMIFSTSLYTAKTNPAP